MKDEETRRKNSESKSRGSLFEGESITYYLSFLPETCLLLDLEGESLSGLHLGAAFETRMDFGNCSKNSVN